MGLFQMFKSLFGNNNTKETKSSIIRRTSQNVKKGTLLEFFFDVADRGKELFPNLTKEGKFEVLMFDIWYCMEIAEQEGFRLYNDNTDDMIESFLVCKIKQMGLDSTLKLERTYMLRCVTDGWENEMISLAHSDYPRTKQYLPGYMYLCFVKEPTKVYTDVDIINRHLAEVSTIKLSNFLISFEEHLDWLVKEYNKVVYSR